jgi:hypothetical protein
MFGGMQDSECGDYFGQGILLEREHKTDKRRRAQVCCPFEKNFFIDRLYENGTRE